MTHGSLFSGIDGFALSAKWAGFTTVFQCEIDPFCISVLRKHWPRIVRFGDIKRVKEIEPVTVLSGGFPCQDISTAGRLAGMNAKRSGLWKQMVRVVAIGLPTWVVFENVYQTWRRWVPVVREALGEHGYYSIPLRVSSGEIGAWHLRRRAFVVAHTDSEQLRLLHRWWTGQGREKAVQFARKWDFAPRRLGANDGVPDWVDRRRAIGNAVNPYQVFPIFDGIRIISSPLAGDGG